jgi:hypothetical protein
VRVNRPSVEYEKNIADRLAVIADLLLEQAGFEIRAIGCE